jgi:quercetin dioxygenase-like cupin family protein
MMTVMRESGGQSKVATGTFTGQTWVDVHMPPRDGVTVGNVLFEPCSRTYWHSHPSGQLLIVLAGEGYVVTDEEAVTVRAGDKIWTPPGVRHWHGASPERFMMHTTVTLGETQWEAEVSNTEYAALR